MMAIITLATGQADPFIDDIVRIGIGEHPVREKGWSFHAQMRHIIEGAKLACIKSGIFGDLDRIFTRFCERHFPCRRCPVGAVYNPPIPVA